MEVEAGQVGLACGAGVRLLYGVGGPTVPSAPPG